MIARCKKTAAALLLGLMGLVMAAYPLAAMPGQTVAAKSCCCKGGHCCHMACCTAPGDSSHPAPVPASSGIQTELQLMVASIILMPPPPATAPNKVSSGPLRPVSLTVVPLFQRDCCYLI